MASETNGLDALGPLARFSILSLFPGTLGAAPQPSNSEQDLDSIHDHVKSLVYQNPKKLLNQAKAVMEENKQLNINVPSNAAHFSLKPDLSQPSVNLDPTFNVEDYEDPNELFAAYARFEHIKEENQKHTGTSQNDNVHFISSREGRTCRPGLGGSYNFHFTESDILPQELPAKNSNAPSSADLQVTGSEKEVDKGLQNELIVAADDNPKKRRLGLDRKRPQFSLKPDLSQPSVNLEPTFNVEDYEDPNELFVAYARFELMKKEIQKHTGTSQKDNVPFTNFREKRTRRPGLGRSYKFHLTESDIFPQEPLAKNSNAPSSADLQESVELYIPSKEREVTGPEKEVDKGILDELLSKNVEDLEGDGAINLLKKHLQIEDVSIEPLCLPEMVSTKASIGNMIKPRRALSDIHNLSNRVLQSSDAKHSGSGGSLSSKNRPKSPHTQIAMLKKRLFNANTSVDPFSSIYVDEVDAHSEDVNRSSNTCIIGKVKSPITRAAEVGTSGATLEHSVHAHDDTGNCSFDQEHSHAAGSIHINDNMTDTVSGFDIDQTARDDDMNIADSSLDVLGQEEAMIPIESDHNMENLNCEENNSTTGLEEPPVCSIIEEQPKDGSSKGSDSAPEQQVVVKPSSESDPNMKNLSCKENTISTDLEDPPLCSIIEEQPKDGSSKGADSAPEQQVEEPTQSLPNGKSKRKLGTRKSNKRKAPSTDENPEDISNPATVDCENAESANDFAEEPVEEASREKANEESKLEQRNQKQKRMKPDSYSWQSLSGGTKWENCKLKKGSDESEKVVRRSTRIRSRPLAFWKGERLLYGRIHESLPTIIGVKSLGSPGDDGKPSLKVKSFVDDKFKDLVEFAGLH